MLINSIEIKDTNQGAGNMRMSNIELCRIVSIFLIILLHSTWQSLGWPKSKEEISFLPTLFYSISICGVDVFLLITGWFGLKAKKSSVVNLIWICLFCGLLRIAFNIYIGGASSLQLLLFISKSNWFVVSYLGLLIISPILNAFVENTTKRQMGLIIVLFYLYSIWFNLFPAKPDIEPGFNYGCSVIWFLEVYLIGRYFNKYGVPSITNKYLLGFVFLVVSIMVMTYLLMHISFSIYPDSPVSTFAGRIGAQNSPFTLCAAICLFLSFQRLKISASKIINHIAKSVLSILILHGVFFDYMRDYYLWLNEKGLGMVQLLLWIFGAVVMMSICIIIDQLRILLYKPIRDFIVK